MIPHINHLYLGKLEFLGTGFCLFYIGGLKWRRGGAGALLYHFLQHIDNILHARDVCTAIENISITAVVYTNNMASNSQNEQEVTEIYVKSAPVNLLPAN